MIAAGLVLLALAAPPQDGLLIERKLIAKKLQMSGAVGRNVRKVTCNAEAPFACARDLARDLAKSMAAKGGLIQALETADVHPARMAGLKRQTIGQVTLRADQPVEDVRVEVRIPRFSERSPISRVERIEAKGVVRVPLAVALDPKELAQHDEDRPVLVRVFVEYTAGGAAHREERSTAIAIFDRNAMSWDAPESIAAFATPQVVLPPKTDHPLAALSAIFPAKLGVRASGCRFDYVQFPAQTLANGGGCADLAVLYASLAESIGIRSLILRTPRRLLVALSASLPEHAQYLLPHGTLVQDGILFVPIDPTAPTFEEGMRLGAAELRSRNATVDVRSARRAHPPVDLSGIAQKPIEPALPDMAPLEPRRDVAALEQLAAQRPQDPIALANLGTAHLADGRPRQALELYAKALPHASKTQAIDIHLDAALAAFASKDRAAFDEHSVAALHAGAADRLSALARTGPRELSLAIGRAFQQTGREPPPEEEHLEQGIEWLMVWL